jgi:hypothetical protein
MHNDSNSPTAPQPAAEPRSTARRGKIARLPHHLRETLNHRLCDGEVAHTLLAWLNAQPEVQSLLAEHFEGRTITEQNLSEWRHGGYEDWAQKELLRASLSDLVEDLDDLGIGGPQKSATERCAEFQALALGRLLMAAMAEPVSERREQRVLALIRAMNSVRRCDNEVERVRLQRERLRYEQVEGLTVPTEEGEMRQKARRYARWHEIYRQECEKAATRRTDAPTLKRPAPASTSISVHPVHPTESEQIQPTPTKPNHRDTVRFGNPQQSNSQQSNPQQTPITEKAPTPPPKVNLPGCGPI